jgi:hypothetical protein
MPDQERHAIHGVHMVDRRGITATGAVAVAICAGLVGGAIDVATGRGLRTVFAVFFILGCAAAASRVHREDLLAAVVIPPLAYVALALIAGGLGATGVTGSFVKRQLDQLVDALIISYPALFFATAAAVVIALMRWLSASGRRTR